MREFLFRRIQRQPASDGFLTGILRIAQESIFSGLNNPTVNSILDETYDKYFGFTRAEVHKMLRDYGALEKEAELKTWYDGYLFGAEEIYKSLVRGQLYCTGVFKGIFERMKF